MNLLSRYIALTFLRNFLFCVSGVALLLVVSLLFGNIESVFSGWEELSIFLGELAAALPRILELVFPLCIILPTAMTFIGLSRSSELNAMKSSGMGRLQLMMPIFVCLIPIAAFLYLNQNYLQRWFQTGPAATSETGSTANRWWASGSWITYIERMEPESQQIFNITRMRWASTPFRVMELQSIARGRQEGNMWELENVRRRYGDAGRWREVSRVRAVLPMSQFEAVFDDPATDVRHVPLSAISGRIREADQKGAPTGALRFAWHQKFAAAAAPFLMVLIAAPLAQIGSRSGRMELNLIVIVIIGIVFIIGNETIFLLGRELQLPALLMAWAVNALTLLMGYLLLTRSR